MTIATRQDLYKSTSDFHGRCWKAADPPSAARSDPGAKGKVFFGADPRTRKTLSGCADHSQGLLSKDDAAMVGSADL